MVGVVVDDDRRAAEHDRQADPRLRVVARLPSRNAAAMPATNGARGEHDQPAVDERERRAQRARPPPARRTGSGGVRAAAGRSAPTAGTANQCGVRRLVRRVVPECHLERALECGDQDQDVEPVPPHERCELAHTRNLLQATAAASYLGRSPDRRLVRARTRPPDDVRSPPGVHRRCIEPNDERNVMESRTDQISRPGAHRRSGARRARGGGARLPPLRT